MDCSLCARPLGNPERRLDGGRAVCSCCFCGLVHLVPLDAGAGAQLTTLDAFAQEMTPWRAAFRSEHERLLARLAFHQPQGRRLLEVGSAMGWFLDSALSQGWDAWGIEPAQISPGIRTAAAAARTQQKTIEEADVAGLFDCIVLVQLVEHLRDPLAVLRSLVERLAPGGVVFLETPNPVGVSARLRRPGWGAANLGASHVHLFRARALAELCRRAGLVVVEERNYFKGLTLGRSRRALRVLNAGLSPLKLGNNVAVAARKPR